MTPELWLMLKSKVPLYYKYENGALKFWSVLIGGHYLEVVVRFDSD